MAVAMVQHSIPFAVSNHFSPLLWEGFKDPVRAQQYKCASTKATCIINEAVAPYFMNELVMKIESPFTLIIDWSSDIVIILTALCFFFFQPVMHTTFLTENFCMVCSLDLNLIAGSKKINPVTVSVWQYFWKSCARFWICA